MTDENTEVHESVSDDGAAELERLRKQNAELTKAVNEERDRRRDSDLKRLQATHAWIEPDDLKDLPVDRVEALLAKVPQAQQTAANGAPEGAPEATNGASVSDEERKVAEALTGEAGPVKAAAGSTMTPSELQNKWESGELTQAEYERGLKQIWGQQLQT